MDYEVRQVDIRKRDILIQVNNLISSVFDLDLAEDRIERTTGTNSTHDNLYLGAFRNGELIGFNGFIAHDLVKNGRATLCYQSCWTATSAEHRGKGIFSQLINAAKEILTRRETAVLFGFPNFNSQPIMEHKLGFRRIPSLKWQVPLPFVLARAFLDDKADDTSNKGYFDQNDRQLIELKRRLYHDDLTAVEIDESLVWGVPRSKEKFGLRVPFFEIGGIKIQHPRHLNELFRQLTDKLSGCRYLQMTTTTGAAVNCMLRNLRPSQSEDLHIFDLNMDTTSFDFNFFGGVRDVY
jgi:GNAT superfamily N-acetyltransferase